MPGAADPEIVSQFIPQAFLLGYSNVRAFTRAFKRWTGKAPGEFRRGGASDI